MGMLSQQPAEHAERAHVSTGGSLSDPVFHMHCALHRCDETNSIEAMEAMEGVSADNLLLPSPFQHGAPASSVTQQRGTTLQVGCWGGTANYWICNHTQPVCARSHVPSAAASGLLVPLPHLDKPQNPPDVQDLQPPYHVACVVLICCCCRCHCCCYCCSSGAHGPLLLRGVCHRVSRSRGPS